MNITVSHTTIVCGPIIYSTSKKKETVQRYIYTKATEIRAALPQSGTKVLRMKVCMRMRIQHFSSLNLLYIYLIITLNFMNSVLRMLTVAVRIIIVQLFGCQSSDQCGCSNIGSFLRLLVMSIYRKLKLQVLAQWKSRSVSQSRNLHNNIAHSKIIKVIIIVMKSTKVLNPRRNSNI